MIKYNFNEELNVLEVFYTDDIYLQDLIEYGEMLQHSETLPRDLKILTDATNANYKLIPAEVKILTEAMKNQIRSYNSVKTAYFHQKPYETAMSYIVKNESFKNDYQHNVFSTREAALHWLLN